MQLKDNNKGKEPMEQDQPDADYIKMFVGQVPRSMDEGNYCINLLSAYAINLQYSLQFFHPTAQLREMFEEFGRVHTINVLRDKSTGLSKGK